MIWERAPQVLQQELQLASLWARRWGDQTVLGFKVKTIGFKV